MQSAVESEVIAAATAALGPYAEPMLELDAFSWTALLPSSVCWDAEGRVPGDDGYVNTWDSDWLAGLAASQFATWELGASTTTKLSVDGDSIEVAPASWGALASSLYQRSPIYGYAARIAQETLGELHVRSGVAWYVPTSRQL